MKFHEENVDSISNIEINRIDDRINALYICCDKIEPISSCINELEVEFNNRVHGASKYFNINSFEKRLCEMENTITSYFNKFGVDRLTFLSGAFKNRMIYEVHNTTKFEIRYFTCIELANPFIKKWNRNNAFQLAKVFNCHHQVVHTPYFSVGISENL
jgi:hypothetical protein